MTSARRVISRKSHHPKSRHPVKSSVKRLIGRESHQLHSAGVVNRKSRHLKSCHPEELSSGRVVSWKSLSAGRVVSHKSYLEELPPERVVTRKSHHPEKTPPRRVIYRKSCWRSHLLMSPIFQMRINNKFDQKIKHKQVAFQIIFQGTQLNPGPEAD